ncbi:SpoIIE family protein phosphatase [Alkalihalobacillus sp. LMS39]|uniref:SpoIIE family protein phosphatase n=1 Tax=Alkalihalobacillus sp. LMS39 TaxID=2924032 RepID=UPI001FB2F985|nr:SpoIIE family protein phosphatase [Alkalihalobacillus sp. LMS39]UOE92586.1 SpoIIE family protein phosphatase [Alkalihalobacillus sp. LMS39]
MNKRFYESLFLHNPNACYLLDKNGKFLDFNENTIKLTGYAKNELVEMDFLPLFEGRDQSYITEKFQSTLKGEKSHFNTKIITKHHREVFIHITCVPVLIENNIYGVVGIAEDITNEVIRKKEQEHELSIAMQTQFSLLPQPLTSGSVHIEGVYYPSELLSGDMYCFAKLDESRYALSILDVMGHGVTSSLIAIASISYLRGQLTPTVNPKTLMEDLNEHIFELFNLRSAVPTFVTALSLVIDVDKKIIEYTNAGHPPGVVTTEQEQLLLPSLNIPLGLMKDSQFKSKTITFAGKARVILYSDGFAEAFSPSISSFVTQFSTCLRKTFSFNNSQFVQKMKQDLPDNRMKQTDDLSMVSMTIEKQ